MFKGKDHVITCAGIVLWDGITKPEVDDKDGSLTHNIRIAIPNNAPELAELTQIAQAALNGDLFKGVLPAGGNWPFAEPDLAKMGPTLAGHTCFTAKTRRGVPGVFDANGAELNAMTFGRSFYPGAKVALYVHAYAYNNKQKGIAFGLDGIQVIDNTAPALAIGGGVSPQEVANAFAAAGAGRGVAGPIMTATATNTYAEYIAAGWTDESLIAAGFMVRPAPAPAPAPAAPPPRPAAAAPAPPPRPAAPPPAPAPALAPTAPHTAILAGGPTMTAQATNTYAEYKASGWDDAGLIAAGLMVAAAAAPAPLATAGSAAPPPPAPTAPAPVAGKIMLPAAGATTYQAYIDAGWTDAMLIQNGFMQP